MGKIVRSARGTKVDFDMIKIKNQIAGAPTSVEIEARKDYIDTKEGIKKKVPIVEPVPEVVEDFEEDQVNDELDDALKAELLAASETTEADPLDLVNAEEPTK